MLKTKLFEVRDSMTCIMVMATLMELREPSAPVTKEALEVWDQELFILRRCGFSKETLLGAESYRMVQLTSISANKTNYDPYAWGGRTYPVAHRFIVEHWDELKSGDVVDVEFILGERTEKKVSERFRQ